MKNLHKSNKGFTLMELMAYLALFGMLLSVIYSVYYQFSRTFSAADATLIKERGAFDVVRRLQNDIRKSGEVAEALGLSDATVRTHVFRAKNALRLAMEPFKEEG